MRVSTCSRVAMPSSTTLFASWIMAPYTRLATKPQALVVSWMTTGFLPHAVATSMTVSAVASLVTVVRMISASRITTGGDAQCHPMTSSGRVVTSAIWEMGKPEVFDARIVAGGAAASRSRKTFCLSSSFSGTASTTRSTAAASSNDDVNERRASARVGVLPASSCRAPRHDRIRTARS